MKELIDIFRMTEISKETRIEIIIKLGDGINREHGMNLTEPLVYELVKALDPKNKLLTDEYFLSRIK